MSTFINKCNSIKIKFESSWLAPSQVDAFKGIAKLLEMPKRINLYGCSGSGKTFLAWNLNKELGLKYYPNINLLNNPFEEKGIIIDNFFYDRSSFRKALIELYRINKVILITRRPIEDRIQKISLNLNENDIMKIKDNLNLIGISIPDNVRPKSLWHLLNNTLNGDDME